jgi:hypothetical protein
MTILKMQSKAERLVFVAEKVEPDSRVARPAMTVKLIVFSSPFPWFDF